MNPLGKALKNSKRWEVRWEAAKALGNIADPASTGVLIAALDDENQDVGCVAAASLASLGDAAIQPLLLALMKQPTSRCLRAGVRHVLRERKAEHSKDQYRGVLAAIETGVVPEAVAVEAYRALYPGKKEK